MGLDKIEGWKLQRVIEGLQMAIANRTLASGSSGSALAELLESARQKLALTEDAEIALEEEKRQKAQDFKVALLIEREVALSMAEKQQYADFLGREFFTKADFGGLKRFYASAWDRLTEEGKAQMSHRIWEGVRRDEYEFSDLPEIVKEKEAKRLYQALRSEARVHENIERISPQDREDFVKAWESGNKSESYKILGRPSFEENVALTAQAPIKSAAVTVGELQATAVKQNEAKAEVKTAGEGNSFGEATLGLDDLKVVDAAAADPMPPLQVRPSGPKVRGS